MQRASSGDFEALLTACLSIDNQVRKHAEDTIKQLSARPEVIPELLQRVQTASNSQIRQLAAVLLRKWIARHWSKLSPEVKTGAQQVLLDRIANEQQHSVRRAMADVVASVAHLTVPQGEWPGLLGFLHQCSIADSAEHREVGLLLFAALFETIGDTLQPHVATILQAVAAGISHPNYLVQTAALSVVEVLLPYVTDAQVPAFHALLAALLHGAQAALAARNEDLLGHMCQVLVEVAECPAPLLQPCLQQVLEMCMTIATNKQFESNTREQALQLLQWMAKFKPKQLARHKPLMHAIIEALCEMCCEPTPPDYDDAQELPPQKVACQALDVLALSLSSQHVVPACWQFVQTASSSPDMHRRAAAMMVCAVSAEGCSEALRKRLPQVLPLLLSALQDQEGDVRGVAAFALGQFSEYLQPEILEHYKDVMPGVFRLLRDPNHDVQERACYALDAFCENLEPSEILPYMPQLVDQLLLVLQNGRPGVQEMALSAVSSIASAAQQAFQPHTAVMLPVLHHFMQHPGKEYQDCRCRAIESAGIIVGALGAEDSVISPHINGMMEVALQGFSVTDSPDLRDHSHAMFSNIAKALGENFAGWLPRVVPLAFESCKQEDGQVGNGDDSDSEGDDDFVSDDDDSEDQCGGKHFNVRTGVMDEKMSATAALGSYAEACPRAFMPYVEQTLAILTDMSNYWHDEARAAAYDSFQKLTLATHKVFPASTSASAVPAAADRVVLSEQSRALTEAAMPLLSSPVEDDVSKVAVTAAAAALGHLLKQLGHGAVGASHLEAAANMAKALLENNAMCQEAEDDEDECDAGDDEELAAEDEELLAAAADLLPALAISMGPDAYAPLFLSLHAEPLIARIKPQQPIALRAIAAGAVAEVAESLGGRIAPVVSALMPLLLRELQSSDDINRQNAAYCSGLLVQASPEQATPYVPQLLTALHNMFRPEEAAGAQDNAVGAVGRIMIAVPQLLPLGQVLPVLLGAMPLKEDLNETTPAVSALCMLMLADRLNGLQQYLPQIIQVFGQVAAQETCPMEARAMAARTLMQLQTKYPENMGPLLSRLPPEQQTALQQLVANSH